MESHATHLLEKGIPSRFEIYQPYINRKLSFEELVEAFDKGCINKVKDNGETITPLDVKVSTVGTTTYTHAVIVTTIRKSKSLSNIHIRLEADYHGWGYGSYTYSDDPIDVCINKVLPEHFRWREHLDNYRDSWTMIVYETGGFFAKHTDSKSDDIHMATLLLLPPRSVNDYKGGELIVYDGTQTTSITPDDTQWKFIAMPLNVYHELKPVTEGRRVVFKRDFHLNKEIMNYFSPSDMIISSPRTIDTGEIKHNLEMVNNQLSAIEQEIVKYQAIKLELMNEKKQLECTLQSYDYTDLLKELDEPDPSHYYHQQDHISPVKIIVLERKYETDNPNMLIGEDFRLFCLLKDKFPNALVKLINEEIKHKIDGDDDYSHRINDEDSPVEKYSRYKFPKLLEDHGGYDRASSTDFVQVIFQNQRSDDIPGELTSKYLEYNDEYYDSVYEFKITAILVKLEYK